ncbi:MAG: hypothetical protein GKR88_02075 [Flavobacteriaceae bacterium]|nr:MAG: hypothetical protein GKR88_02075 [Flavobacteriaceae bacterium]
MIPVNAGKEFRKGFLTLFETFKSTVLIHQNYKCNNAEIIEVQGMKNADKKDSSKIMFQFPEKFEVNKGDVIQQKGSTVIWKIYEIEDRVVNDAFICFVLHVKK